MIKITIPEFRKVEDEHEKNYTVFVIDVYVSGRTHTLEKRYTEFEELHKQLRKSVNTPEFPPKKVLKWNSKVLEQRRQGLQVYLQGIIDGELIPKSLLKFLTISMPMASASFDSLDEIEPEPSVTHHPVVGFVEEPFLQDTTRSSLPDIIIQGVNMGLYSNDDY